MISDKNYLTVHEFRKMWKSEILPSIRREVKLEIETLSDKYDTVRGIQQATVEPRFNEVAGDRPNLFVKSRVRYIENFDKRTRGKTTKMYVISRS